MKLSYVRGLEQDGAKFWLKRVGWEPSEAAKNIAEENDPEKTSYVACIAQINEQQYEYLKPKTAQERIHLKFWHPHGRHDDQLYALALACSASTEAPPLGKGAILLPHQNS